MRNTALENIAGYQEWLERFYSNGWEIWFVTLQFRHLGSDSRVTLSIMGEEIQRIYSTLLTRLIRNPNQRHESELPAIIGCPDKPVSKNKPTIRLAEVIPNDGVHYHFLLAVPPKPRLLVSLDEHFRNHHAKYRGVGGLVDRIHVEPVNMIGGRVADYMLKHYKRGTFTSDEVLVLPRIRSEMPPAIKSPPFQSKVLPHELRAAFQRLLNSVREPLLAGRRVRLLSEEGVPLLRIRPVIDELSGKAGKRESSIRAFKLLVPGIEPGITRPGTAEFVLRDLEPVFALAVLRDEQFQHTRKFKQIADALEPLCNGEYRVVRGKPIGKAPPRIKRQLRRLREVASK